MYENSSVLVAARVDKVSGFSEKRGYLLRGRVKEVQRMVLELAREALTNPARASQDVSNAVLFQLGSIKGGSN